MTSQSLRNHLKNESGLGVGAVKVGDNLTGDYLLPIDSTLAYLEWAFSHSKKLKYDVIEAVIEEIKCLNEV